MYGEEYDDRFGGAFEDEDIVVPEGEEHTSDCAVWRGERCDGKLCETAYAFDAGDDAYNMMMEG